MFSGVGSGKGSLGARAIDGETLGTVSTSAVTKFGDILIEGVPIEFD